MGIGHYMDKGTFMFCRDIDYLNDIFKFFEIRSQLSQEIVRLVKKAGIECGRFSTRENRDINDFGFYQILEKVSPVR